MKSQKRKASKPLKPGKRIEKKAPLLKYNLTDVHTTGIQTGSPPPPPPPPIEP